MHCSFFSRPAIFTYNTVVECCLHITKNIEVDVRDICSYTFPFKTAKMFFWKSSACGKNFGGKSFTFTHDLVLKYFVFKYFLVLLALILPNFTSNLFQSKSKKNLHFTKRQAGIYCFENIIYPYRVNILKHYVIQPPHRQDLVAMSLTRTSLVYVTWVYHQLHNFFKNIQVANLILPYNDIFVIESAAFKLLIKFVYYLSPTPVDIDQDQITIWLIHSSYISTNLYFRGKIKKCISIMINFISTLKRINHYYNISY